MTEPIDQEAPELVGIGAQSVKDRGRELGLTWTMRLATVLTVEDDFNRVTAIYDGDADETAITMTNMIGYILPGWRVYALYTPRGNFVIGRVVTSGQAYIWGDKVTLASTTANLTLSDIPDNLASLWVTWTGRDTTAVAAAATSMIVNGDASLSYGHRFIQGAGATASALTHTQSFGAVTSAIVGAHPGATATAGRFAVGEIVFPAWNGPHANFLGWIFHGGFETAANSGFYLTGDGVYGAAGPPYDEVTLIAQTAWDVGSQITGWGLVIP